MNLTLWILIIAISLCIKLTEQVGGAGSSNVKEVGSSSVSEVGSSSVNEVGSSSGTTARGQICKKWINDAGFLDEDRSNPELNYKINKDRAVDRKWGDDINRHIYALAYIHAITNSKRPLYPNQMCLRYRKTHEDIIPFITPSNTQLTCPEWLELSGYYVDNPENDYHATVQYGNFSYKYLSNCGAIFTPLLYTETSFGISISTFCITRQGIPDGVKVSYYDCRDPELIKKKTETTNQEKNVS